MSNPNDLYWLNPSGLSPHQTWKLVKPIPLAYDQFSIERYDGEPLPLTELAYIWLSPPLLAHVPARMPFWMPSAAACFAPVWIDDHSEG